MGYDCAVVAFDDSGEDAECRGRAVVVGEDVRVAIVPGTYWGVDGLLDVCAVEVDGCSWWEVVPCSGEAEDIPFDLS